MSPGGESLKSQDGSLGRGSSINMVIDKHSVPGLNLNKINKKMAALKKSGKAIGSNLFHQKADLGGQFGTFDQRKSGGQKS